MTAPEAEDVVVEEDGEFITYKGEKYKYNEQIREKTGWFRDKNGDWKFRITDKDMTLKKDIRHIITNKEYDLDDLIKYLDNIKLNNVLFVKGDSNGKN